jgi:AraC-like DNA-binding protein
VSGYFSTGALPGAAPTSPVVFDLERLSAPRSIEEISDLLGAARGQRALDLELQPSAVARRAKALIDQHYLDGRKIAELGRELRVSHAVLSRYFRKNYGMTPLQYRNNLRVTDSWLLLLTRHPSITTVAHEVGFQDKSRFNQQFKKYLKVTPSQFRLA